jgi:putative AlgH/UPF0301 family transcriptional regulator
MTVADPLLSRAVLIGAGTYEDMTSLPAVGWNLVDLREVLADPEIWGLPEENCTVIADEPNPVTVARRLRAAAEQAGADGLLIMYYAGHGLVHGEDLMLGLPQIDPRHPDEGGLPYRKIREAARSSPARRRVVILDCCYAGRAEGEFLAPGDPAVQLANEADIDETCLFVAVGANRPAAAPLNERNTAFTGALLSTIRDGLPIVDPVLTVRAIATAVRRRLAAAGHETPELRERNSGGSIALVRNVHARRQNLTGAILLAGRQVTDPELRREAVLVLRHNQTGAMGIRLTRPYGPLPESLNAWRSLIAVPRQLFDGGPVARDGYIALVLLRPQAGEPLRFTPVRGRLGSLPLTTAVDGVRDSIAQVRIFSGYLGWAAGDLEGLVNRDVLRRADVSLRQVFGDPQHLRPSMHAA